MNRDFVPFDDMRRRVLAAFETLEAIPEAIHSLYLVRDLRGRVRISVSDTVESDEVCRDALDALADRLFEVLGAHGYPPEEAVLFVSDTTLESLRDTAKETLDRVYWVDRLVTGLDWWSVGNPCAERAKARRYTLFSVKGGVGRSTTAAILSWHLARKGARVLVADLDLESPGLSSAMFDERARPDFGIADWFVEALVDQGENVIENMTARPAWAGNLEGDVRVAPAHGADPGEYLAKLGRVYMDSADDPWAVRLNRLLDRLENTEFKPTVILLESRSGLHDIAAATVTDINADVLLFATDSDSTWTDYKILFRHWRDQDLATKIRKHLLIVSALTPDLDTENYLRRFRQESWDLFRDHLYDEVGSPDETGGDFSFDLDEEGAPHDPMPIYWTRGLSAGTSLHSLEESTVNLAYTRFLDRFDQLMGLDDGENR